jgi:hypothetical protein
LKGAMQAMTPSGSLIVKLTWCSATGGTEEPCELRAISA